MTSDKEKKKREIFEGMSARRQQRILKKGYDKWDPFLEPKEPPFFREEERNRIRRAAVLMDRFITMESVRIKRVIRKISPVIMAVPDITRIRLAVA